MSDTNFTTSVVCDYLSSLNNPRALTVYLLFKNLEHQQLVDLKFDPLSYNSYEAARDSLAATEFLSKSKFLSLSIDKKEIALDKFFLAEEVCKQTNVRLGLAKCHSATLFRAQKKISQILGEFDCEEFVDSCTWGPGSTLSIRAHSATATRKFEGYLEVTPSCYRFIAPWFSSAYPLWVPDYKLVEGNKVITVDKNAKTDRVIAIEPSGNLWFQKGIGSMIKRRLKHSGIDLSDQSCNQKLSRIGSRFNKLATVDFSSASDTISYYLILDLLPYRWFDIMDRLRSPRGCLNDSIFEYEKFSSMGNGFTFELESLIFYAIALSVVPEDHPLYSKISIYGDDLIIPSDFYNECLEVFEYIGFSFNKKKSYYSTYYRESCGKHYWNGIDITPLYLKESITNETHLFKIGNAIRRYSNRIYSYGCDKRFRTCWSKIRNHLKNSLGEKSRLLWIPDNYGEGGLVGNLDEACPPRARDGHEGYRVLQLVEIPFVCETDSPNLRLTRYWVTQGSDFSYGNGEFLPRRTRRRRVIGVSREWRDLGPWI
jgi:hypothetical protein